MSCIESDVLIVDVRKGQQVIELLKKLKVLKKGVKVARLGKSLAIPIDINHVDLDRLIMTLKNMGVDAVHDRMCLEVDEGRIMRGRSFRDLLSSLLPPDILERIPRSFDIVGDIALIELDEDIAENYGAIIAEAIMKLHPSIRSVFARGRTVGVERVRELRFLGGEFKTMTIHKEYGIKIAVDVARAYFNPSLALEHRRIAEKVRDNELVLDLFTGVGPFALHIAKLHYAYVVACDINPDALRLLCLSLKLNRLRGLIEPLNVDAFHLVSQGSFRKSFNHIIMNLPHKAIELLPYVVDLVHKMGFIHVYLIASSSDEALNLIRKHCVNRRTTNVVEVVRVLDYSPRKYVYRVSLQVE